MRIPSLFCPPSNGELRPLWGPPASQLGTSHKLHTWLRENSGSLAPVLRFVDNVVYNLTPRAKGGKHLGGYGLAGLSGYVSLSGMPTAQQPLQHPSAVSLPRSLGSATAHAAHYCRSAHWISLLLPAEGSSSHNLTPPLSGLSPSVRSQLQDCVCGLSRPSSLLTSHVCFHLLTFRCFNEWMSQECLYVVQGILCWVIAVQIVEISRGETKGISHIAIPLIPLL